MMSRAVFALVLGASAFAVEPVQLRPALRVDRDDRPIPKPAPQQVSELYDIVYNSWFRHLSVENAALAARDKGALNVNAWDEVPDCSWFTNRASRRALSFDEIVAGLQAAPPKTGMWTIDKNEAEGYTPKFRIKDSTGAGYYVKFDLPDAPERNSAAERISTLILYAAGYNVPGNTITRFRREDLLLASESQFQDNLGKRRPMTSEDLEAALKQLKPAADGRYRGLASPLLAGGLGKFKYSGTRKDDANDIIPHELRRELRGLRVIASWINHADAGDKNTLDAFVRTAGDQGYIKHYLLDFGSTLGSGNYYNGPFRVGHEYLFDGYAMGRTFISFGGWRRPWDAQGRIQFPEVGYYDAVLFDPPTWKTNYPNLAFVRMDEGDAYWGAKIVTAFADATIDKIAEAGEYSRPEAMRYVAGTLKRRRDIIGRYWFDRVSPLEQFEVSGNEVRFRDLAVDMGYEEAASRRYRCWLKDPAGKKRPEPIACAGHACTLPDLAGAGNPHLWLMIQSNRRDGLWAAPVAIALGHSRKEAPLEVRAWSHAPH